MIYGQRVRQLRAMHGMTQADLAGRVLLKQYTLSRRDKNQVPCDEQKLAALAVELG